MYKAALNLEIWAYFECIKRGGGISSMRRAFSWMEVRRCFLRYEVLFGFW